MDASLRIQLGGSTKDTDSVSCCSFVSVKQDVVELFDLVHNKGNQSECD